MRRAISWKRVLITIIAFWLISNGFETLSFLNELELADLLRHSDKVESDLLQNGFTIINLGKLFIGAAIANTIGLLFAFLISIVSSTRRRGYWLTALPALVLIGLINRYDLFGRYYLLKMPGSQFRGVWYYIFYGLLMVVTGVLLLWFNKEASHNTGRSKASSSPNYA